MNFAVFVQDIDFAKKIYKMPKMLAICGVRVVQ